MIRPRQPVVIVVLLVFMSLIASACSHFESAADSSAKQGLLARENGEVLFVQWTQAQTKLSGTMQLAYVAADGTQLDSRSGAISGTNDGASVTIEVGAVLSASAVSGSFEGSDLTLAIPNPNGSLSTVRFLPSSVAAYNAAVGSLRSEAHDAVLLREEAIAATRKRLTNTCVDAGGRVVPNGGGSAFPSSCAVAGVSDPVKGGATTQASYAFSPATIGAFVQSCRAHGGSWGANPPNVSDPYYWECTIDGFQDAVTSFSGSYTVALSSAHAMADLMDECNNLGGTFEVDGNPETYGFYNTDNDFSCYYDKSYDVVLSPSPHYVIPLPSGG